MMSVASGSAPPSPVLPSTAPPALAQLLAPTPAVPTSAAAGGTAGAASHGAAILSLTGSGTRPGSGGSAVQGQAILPLLGTVPFTGTVQGGNRWSIIPAARVVPLGPYALSNPAYTLGPAGVSLQGDTALPMIGPVHLAGSVQDGSHYALSATLPQVSLGSVSLANAVVTVGPGGIAIQGQATLPAVGPLQLSGSIQDATHFTLTGSLPSLNLGGKVLSADHVTLTPGALSVQGLIGLPLVGPVSLSGRLSDASHYSLGGTAGTVQVGPDTLSGAAVMLGPSGMTLQGNANLPVLGVVPVSGGVQDATHYSLGASLRSVKVGAYTLTGATVTLSQGGLAVNGTANLPLFGPEAVSGTIQDATHYSLSSPSTAGGLGLTGGTTTTVGGLVMTPDGASLSGAGLSVQAVVNLPLAGPVTLSGTVQDSTHFNLGSTAVAFGSFLRADVSAQWDASTSRTVLSFANVAVNTGGFATSFLGALVGDLKTATKSLLPAAQTLLAPLPGLESSSDIGQIIGSNGISALDVLNALSIVTGNLDYATDASEIESFANAVVQIGQLAAPSGTGGWTNLGSFTATVGTPGGPAALNVVASSLANTLNVTQLVGSIPGLTSLQQLGIQFPVLSDPTNFFKIIAGATNVDLVTYALPSFNAQTPLAFKVPLAVFPIAVVITGTAGISGSISIQGGATFAFNTSGVASGNLLSGFTVKDASLSATASLGGFGEIDLGDATSLTVVGYNVTGAANLTATATLSGNTIATSVTGPTGTFTASPVGPHVDPWGIEQGTVQDETQPFFGGKLNPFYWLTRYHSGKDLATALRGDGVDLGEVTRAFYNGITQSYSAIAGYLYAVDQDLYDIGTELATVYATYADVALAVVAGIGNVTLVDIAQAVDGAGAGYAAIANTLWTSGLQADFTGGFGLPDVGYALGKVGADYRHVAQAVVTGIGNVTLADVAGAVQGAGADFGGIADALWNGGIKGSFPGGFGLPDVGLALQKVGAGYRDVALAVVDGIGNLSLSNIAQAVQGAGANFASVADALWYSGVAGSFQGGFGTYDVGAALAGVEAGFNDVALAVAGSIGGLTLSDVARAVSGAGANFQSIANTLWYSGVAADFPGGYGTAEVGAALAGAGAGFNQIALAVGYGIGGLQLTDIARAVHGAGATFQTVANALWHSGVAGAFPGGFGLADVGAALHGIGAGFREIALDAGGGIGNLSLSSIAVVVQGAGAGIHDIADALWNSGVAGDFQGGFDDTDLAYALKDVGAGFNDVLDALQHVVGDVYAYALSIVNSVF